MSNTIIKIRGDYLEWNFDENTPIYLQIIEQIKKCIATGELQADEKLPAVRELAVTAGVNPNTMQKARHSLKMKVIFTQ